MKRFRAGGMKTLSTALMTIALLVVGAMSANAQSTEPQKQSETQELRDKLKLLEQTVTELKEQLNALTEAKQNPKPAIVEAVYNPNPTTTAAKKPAPVTVTMLPDDSSSRPDPTSKTPVTAQQGESTFEVYGFAMLDAGYQFKTNHPDWFDTLRTTKLPSFGGEFAPNGRTYWGVRQSRLGVKSSTPTKFGELKTVFEFELFGTGADAGQTTFRLRHAYGELGQVGAGQYWTVFGDTDAFPNSFEYWGPPGLIWFRNVGFRWMPLKGRNSITIGLERPGASADGGIYADRIEIAGIKPVFKLPDLMGNVRFQRDWGHVQIGGIVRSIKWKDIDTTNPIDFSGSAVGFGGNLTSALNFGKNDVGRFSVIYGKGIQNYFNDAPTDVGIKNEVSSNGAPVTGVALPIFGMSAFLDHRWNERFTTAAGYSMINIENSNGQRGDAFRQGHYALANLAYYPVQNVMIGGEFQYGRRSNFFDGFSSEDFRIQFAFKYNFSRMLKL